MGQDVWQDWAIPLEAIHGVLNLLNSEWALAEQWMHKTTCAGAFTVIAFCGSF